MMAPNDNIRGERDAKLRGPGDLAIRGVNPVDTFLCEVLHDDLGDGVWDLLEQHGNETRVEALDGAFLRNDRFRCSESEAWPSLV